VYLVGHYGATEVGQLMTSVIPRLPWPVRPRRPSSVVVTGTTGSLDAHVASQLAQDPNIDAVYCLVHAADKAYAKRRVISSLADRRVLHYLTFNQRRKLRCLPFYQSDKRLGLAGGVYKEIVVTNNLRAVIHCAWSVNFNLHLSSFEQDCLAGVHNLLVLCKAADDAVFSFALM
jgi:thioester reductase-like protein